MSEMRIVTPKEVDEASKLSPTRKSFIVAEVNEGLVRLQEEFYFERHECDFVRVLAIKSGWEVDEVAEPQYGKMTKLVIKRKGVAAA